MNVIVTGGAGYVGSVVTKELLKNGHKVVVVDNLEQGHRAAVLPDAEFVLVDLCNWEALDAVFQRFSVDAVMHLAAETAVEHSMTDPRRYFQSNVLGGMNLLEAMLTHGVFQLVFSSSAAVYGEPGETPILEDHPKHPVNAYGESKLIFERMLDWYGRAYGLKYISFRYFNAAGASELLGEDHRPETHLIPNILKAVLDGNSTISIFGTDYPTKDGSCVRDYVHVLDIANAHILALAKLDECRGRVYNLGSGNGYSVLELVDTVRKVTGADVPTQVSPRRVGDPATVVASSHRSKRELGWQSEFSELENIIASAWKWLKEHPDGYES